MMKQYAIDGYASASQRKFDNMDLLKKGLCGEVGEDRPFQKSLEHHNNPDRLALSITKEDSVSTIAESSESSPESLIKNNASSLSKCPTEFQLRTVFEFLRIYDEINEGAQSESPDGSPPAQSGADGGGEDNSTNANPSINTQTSTSLPSAVNRRKLGRQRRRKDGEDPPDRRGRKTGPRAVERRRPFACVFYLADSDEHWACRSCSYIRVSDLRQHIKRKHGAPLYCPRCGDKFKDILSRDNHINAGSCQVCDFPKPWATPEMLDAMVAAAAELTGRTNMDRWFVIWEIMMPGRTRPRCPFSDRNSNREACVQEVVDQFQPQLDELPPEQRHEWRLAYNRLLSFAGENENPRPSEPIEPISEPIVPQQIQGQDVNLDANSEMEILPLNFDFERNAGFDLDFENGDAGVDLGFENGDAGFDMDMDMDFDLDFDFENGDADLDSEDQDAN